MSLFILEKTTIKFKKQVTKWLTEGKPDDAFDSSTGEDGDGDRFVGSCCISDVDDKCINWGCCSVGGGADSDGKDSEDVDSGVGAGRGNGENCGAISSCKQEMCSYK